MADIKSLSDRSAATSPTNSALSVTELEQRLQHAAPLAAVGKISAGAAHEINQPLNVIRMAAFNLRRGLEKGSLDTTAALDKLAAIDAQISRAAELVGAMKAFSPTSRGGVATIQPAAAMRVALALMSRRFSAEMIELNHVDAEGAGELQADPAALQTLIVAIIDNAVEALSTSAVATSDPVALMTAAATSGVGVNLEPDNAVRRIDVSETLGDGCYRFTVSDNAGGIPDDILPRVFDPYFTTATDGSHPGLGLTVASAIVAEMGGSISLANKPMEGCGVGLSVTVELPISNPIL